MTEQTKNRTYLRTGTQYRVTVMKESDGIVEFAPKGGGFWMRIPSEKFHAEHQIEKEAPKIVPAFFGGDWSDVIVPGYTVQGARWNGWGMPYFTKAAAQYVASEISGDGGNPLRYNAEKDAFEIMVNGELEEFEGGDIDVPNVGRVRVYAVGAGGWCWDFYESEKSARNLPVAPLPPMELTGWINEDHCSLRCLVGTDPSVIANRVAFIEKTPRIRVAPFTEVDDYKNWQQGLKGSAPEYGRYQSSRDWCDQQLLSMGYLLGPTQAEGQSDDPIERPRG